MIDIKIGGYGDAILEWKIDGYSCAKKVGSILGILIKDVVGTNSRFLFSCIIL